MNNTSKVKKKSYVFRVYAQITRDKGMHVNPIYWKIKLINFSIKNFINLCFYLITYQLRSYYFIFKTKILRVGGGVIPACKLQQNIN
jgi:hypothetical protein